MEVLGTTPHMDISSYVNVQCNPTTAADDDVDIDRCHDYSAQLI